jgi:hypothetical protein
MTRMTVSDHAVLRYLERVKGVDVKAARAEIAGLVASAEAHPACVAVRLDGWRFVIRDGTVTTVHRACQPDRRSGRQRGEGRAGRDE